MYSHDKGTVASGETINCMGPTLTQEVNVVLIEFARDRGVGNAPSMMSLVGLQALACVREKRICHLGKVR